MLAIVRVQAFRDTACMHWRMRRMSVNFEGRGKLVEAIVTFKPRRVVDGAFVRHCATRRHRKTIVKGALRAILALWAVKVIYG